MIAPWVFKNGQFVNPAKPKASAVSAEDIVDKLLSKVKQGSIKRFFEAKHTWASSAVERIIFDSIANAQRDMAASNPGYSVICNYLLQHGRHRNLTKTNVDMLLSAALKPFLKTLKAGDTDSDGKKIEKLYNHYVVPTNSDMGRALQQIEWENKVTKETKKFTVKGNTLEFGVLDRRYIISAFFPEDKSSTLLASPREAAVPIFCEIVDVKPVKE